MSCLKKTCILNSIFLHYSLPYEKISVATDWISLGCMYSIASSPLLVRWKIPLHCTFTTSVKGLISIVIGYSSWRWIKTYCFCQIEKSGQKYALEGLHFTCQIEKSGQKYALEGLYFTWTFQLNIPRCHEKSALTTLKIVIVLLFRCFFSHSFS